MMDAQLRIAKVHCIIGVVFPWIINLPINRTEISERDASSDHAGSPTIIGDGLATIFTVQLDQLNGESSHLKHYHKGQVSRIKVSNNAQWKPLGVSKLPSHIYVSRNPH